MPADVAIAVVSYNTAALLDRCLASLRAEHEAGRAEVWVVDNGSTDGSVDVVRDRHPWATLVVPGENLGFGAAVNRVAAATDTPFVAAANADVAPEPGALVELLAAAARRPEAGLLAPRLIRPDGSTQHSVHPFPTVTLGLLLSTGLAARPQIGRRLPMEGLWDADRERDVDWAHGAFLLARRRAWEVVGGFDSEQWLYAEDLDLAWRLRRAGFTSRYVPSARVAHALSAATSERWSAGERAVRTQRSAYAWMLDRQGEPRMRAVAAAHLLGPLVRGAVLAAGARVAPDRYAARAARQRRWAKAHRTGLEPARTLAAHRARRG